MWRSSSFLILGAQRGGTTSLYDHLTKHPRIARAKTKEVHYFDLNYTRGPSWYEEQFLRPPRLRRNLVRGEASPYYLFHPEVPARAKALLPDAKLVVLLRDPVSRAFSHYQMERRHGSEDLSFADAVRAEPDRLDGEAEKLIDPAYISFSHQKLSYFSRGLYADQIERWLRFYPRERFLFLPSEDLYVDPGSTLNRVLDFLGLDSIDLPTYAHRNLGGYEDRMDPGMRASLYDLYRPHNQRLYVMLEHDFGWSS